MQVTVTGRKIEMTDALRNYAEEKILKKVKKHMDRTIDAHIVLSVEKYRHIAEVTINVNGTIIHGKEETEDMYSSIDSAVDKIERQMKRHKERIVALKSKREAGLCEKKEGIKKTTANNSVNKEVQKYGIERPLIIKKKRLEAESMSVEEAVKQMDILNSNFFVFTNSKNDKVNVLYQIKDGNYGLIEPN